MLPDAIFRKAQWPLRKEVIVELVEIMGKQDFFLPRFDSMPPCPPWSRTHSFMSFHAARPSSAPVVDSKFRRPWMTMSNVQRPSPGKEPLLATIIPFSENGWMAGLLHTAHPSPGDVLDIFASTTAPDGDWVLGASAGKGAERIETAAVAETGAILRAPTRDLDVIRGRCGFHS